MLQSLLGNLDAAVRTFQNYYSVWRQFGGLPEFYSIPQGFTVDKREGYPLRPGLPPRETEDGVRPPSKTRLNPKYSGDKFNNQELCVCVCVLQS